MGNETWLLEKGDEILPLKADGTLSGVLRAVYCLWVIDYSIRNGGDLEAVEDLHPEAPDELSSIAAEHSLVEAQRLMQDYARDGFEDIYYDRFDKVVNEMRSRLE